MQRSVEISDRDEILDDVKFRSLPEEIQKRILASRDEDRARYLLLEEWERLRRRRVVTQAVLVFTFFYLLASRFSWSTTLIAPLVGAGVGLVWWKLNAGSLLSALTAMAAFYLLGMIRAGGEVPPLFLIISMYPMGLISAYLGGQRLQDG